MMCGLYRLSRPDGFATQYVQRTVMGYPKKPRAKRRRFGQPIEGDKRLGKGILHHVFALDHRAQETRTIAMKLRPQLSSKGEKLSLPIGL